ELKNEVVIRAVEDAKRKADNVASVLNIKIVGVKSIIISDMNYPLPPIVIRDIQTSTTPVPTILPGETQITATVQVTYLIS
ncbi:MAG: SIMPL domain-containing protein, partial [Nitrososphaerales archaeon]